MRAVVAVLVLWFGVAAAEEAPTIVTGRVVDVVGRPIRDARIYVMPRAGRPYEARTNKDGRYSVTVQTAGTHGVVIAIDKAHTFRTVIVQRAMSNTLDVDLELDSDGGEVVKIEDTKRPQPAVTPKPIHDVRQSLPYSDEAVERDAWALAWLLLDVDESGRVTRLKLLKKPGFDLDAICIREGLKLRFAPARDGSGHPMKTYVLWKMEWPAWGWLLQGNGITVRRPVDAREVETQSQNVRAGNRGLERTRDGGEGRMATDVNDRASLNIAAASGVHGRATVGGTWASPLATANAFEGSLARVPCEGSGPLNLDLRNRAYRDCSRPDMSIAEALPWISNETAATAIAELAAADLQLVVDEGPPPSKIPQYIATGVTAGAIVAWVGSYLTYDKYAQRMQDHAAQLTVDPEQYKQHERGRSKWAKITIAMTGAVVVSTGVTLFLWNRNQSRRSFSVQPTGDGQGAALSFGGLFD